MKSFKYNDNKNKKNVKITCLKNYITPCNTKIWRKKKDIKV